MLTRSVPASLGRFGITVNAIGSAGSMVSEPQREGVTTGATSDKLSPSSPKPNGELLNAAEEAGFDLLLTTDRRIHYQQNLEVRRIGLVVLPGSTK